MSASPSPLPRTDEPSAADVVGTSRALAAALRSGTHRLSDGTLRELYGIRRVTPAARTAIARELERAGLEPVGAPGRGPVVVRQSTPDAADGLRLGGRRRRASTLAAAAAVVVAAGAAGVALDGGGGGAPAAATSPAPATTDVARTATAPATVALPAAMVFTAASNAADADQYVAALALARPLGERATERIARKVSRRLALRARRALAGGSRGRARALLTRARAFPVTPEVTRERRRLAAADRSARVAARAAATAATTATAPTGTVPVTPAG